jgi:hypothetical protein
VGGVSGGVLEKSLRLTETAGYSACASLRDGLQIIEQQFYPWVFDKKMVLTFPN